MSDMLALQDAEKYDLANSTQTFTHTHTHTCGTERWTNILHYAHTSCVKNMTPASLCWVLTCVLCVCMFQVTTWFMELLNSRY